MTSYSEMLAQIESLKKQAEKQRKEEYSSVIKTIKKQIAEYGISASELGFASAKTPKAPKASASKKGKERASSRAGTKVAPKYRDASGNTWTGRGKMPKWVSEAVASGRSLEAVLISNQ